MSGQSYYGNLGATELNANKMPPDAPRDFNHIALPENTEENETRFKFHVRIPSRRKGTLEEALSDDVYTIDSVSSAAVDGVYGIGVDEILLNADLTGSLAPGDRISFGASPVARYVVKEILADRVKLEYQTIEEIEDDSDLNKLLRVAEAPPTMRSFRVNTNLGRTVDVRDFDGTLIYNWECIAQAGFGEDRNHAVVNIDDTKFKWAKFPLKDGGFNPIVLAAAAGMGQFQLTVNVPDIETYINPIYPVAIGEDSGEAYPIVSASGSTIVLGSPLLKSYPEGLQIFSRTDIPFTRYAVAPLSEFSVYSPFAFLLETSKLNLYYAEVPQTQGAPGVKIELDPGAAEIVFGGADASTEITITRTQEFFRGRKLYWGCSISDAGLTPNESAKDLNAWAVSEPGQPVDGSIDDSDITDITIGYGRITDGGMNPNFFDAMGGFAMPDYSTVAGYDVFAKETTPLTLTGGGGYYRATSSKSGLIAHSALQVGDFVKVINGAARVLWIAKVTYPGQVEFDASALKIGNDPEDYTALAQVNFSVAKATINPATDSILPLSPDPVPLKQYITEALDTAHFYGAEFGKDYVIVMRAVDTTCALGKL